MSRKLLCGTALAVLLSTAPALAQNAEDCRLTNVDPAVAAEHARAIDANGDGRVGTDELTVCLDRQGVPPGERASFTDEFAQLDADGDRVVIIAELAAVGSEGRAAQVAVSQAAPTVAVTQPAPTVAVDQAQPQVSVQQAEPQVAVQQAEPRVSVQQAQPEVSVQQAEPQVEVQQGEPEISIEQPEPQIAIEAPPPQVDVQQAQPDVQVQQSEPRVTVNQAEPVVSIEQAQPDVQIQSEEPKVVINQAEPVIEIQRVPGTGPAPAPADATAMTAATDAAPVPAPETAAVPAPEIAAAPAPVAEQPTQQSALATGVPFGELEGATAFNTSGAELGDVSNVVREKTSGTLFVVVSAGGFLGVGDKTVVLPYSDVAKVDDRIVIDTALSPDDLSGGQDYNADAYEDAE